ncbi:MAG: hypothetical protein J5563_01300 [Clostridia bacterium]|nr:hypothetical protein [Clostridia bacterium]
MKKIVFVLLSVVMLLPVFTLAGIYAEDRTDEFLECISEMSKVWARFEGKQSWDEVYKMDEQYNGADKYPVDSSLILDYMESIFTAPVAEDMLHRKNSGLFYEDETLYQKGGWSSQFGDSVRYAEGDGYSFEPSESSIRVRSFSGRTAVLSVTYYFLSDSNDENSQLVKYEDNLEFKKTSAGWRINGGEMLKRLFEDFPVQDYEGRNVQTGDAFPAIVFLSLVIVIAVLVPGKRIMSAGFLNQ